MIIYLALSSFVATSVAIAIVAVSNEHYRRVRHVRFNDLIDPTAIPLETEYGCLVESDQPIVVQMIHQDTRQAANALFSTLAFPVMD